MGVLQRNKVSQRPPVERQALCAYGVHLIVVLLDVRCVAIAGVESPSTGSLETAQPEPSLGQVIEHGCEDPIEVV